MAENRALKGSGLGAKSHADPSGFAGVLDHVLNRLKPNLIQRLFGLQAEHWLLLGKMSGHDQLVPGGQCLGLFAQYVQQPFGMQRLGPQLKDQGAHFG